MKRSIAGLLIAGAVLSPATPAAAQTGQIRTLQLQGELRSWSRLGGVAVDGLGFIYVSNFGNSVWRVTPDGAVELLDDSLYGASGNTIDRRGDLIQSSFYDGRLVRIRRDGEREVITEQGLAGPVGVTAAPDSAYYVCNCTDNTIARVAPDGATRTFATSDDFACPNGITFDDRGDLYVVSFNNDHVVRIDADGNASRFATLAPGDGNGHIAFFADAFWVTKTKTNQIVRLARDGGYAVVAGTGELGQLDGAAAEATLSRPNGIAVIPNSPLLIFNDLDGVWRSGQPGNLTLRLLDYSQR